MRARLESPDQNSTCSQILLCYSLKEGLCAFDALGFLLGDGLPETSPDRQIPLLETVVSHSVFVRVPFSETHTRVLAANLFLSRSGSIRVSGYVLFSPLGFKGGLSLLLLCPGELSKWSVLRASLRLVPSEGGRRASGRRSERRRGEPLDRGSGLKHSKDLLGRWTYHAPECVELLQLISL